MERLPLSIFEEIGKFIDIKGFVTILSLSKKIRQIILSSNIKVDGFELTFPYKMEYVFYKKHKRYLTNIKFKINNWTDNSIKVLCDIDTHDVSSLDLSDCTKITDKSFTEVVLKIKSLQSLNLSRCYNITDETIGKALVKLTSLQNLNLSFCNITDKLFSEALLKLKSLQALDLSWCDDITDESIKGLVKLESLQTLNLSYCDRITDTSIKELVNLKSLQNLLAL